MRLYFDTNIYRFIRAVGEVREVKSVLNAYGCEVIASGDNLDETYAISSAEDALAEIHVLTTVADRFEEKPASWLHATELLNELRRVRPGWIRKIPAAGPARVARQFLVSHKQTWSAARKGELPSSESYSAYRRDFEAGVYNSRHRQKESRHEHLQGTPKDFLVHWSDGSAKKYDGSDPEVNWRVEGIMAWFNAVELKSPSSRDYADWLSPWLKPGSFKDRSYPSFWMKDASAEAMPLNRLVGLVDFYQLDQKVTHGNAADKIHATHWLRSDLFVTADRGFHEALNKAAEHFPGHPRPALLDRSAPDCAGQLESIIRRVAGERNYRSGR